MLRSSPDAKTLNVPRHGDVRLNEFFEKNENLNENFYKTFFDKFYEKCFTRKISKEIENFSRKVFNFGGDVKLNELQILMLVLLLLPKNAYQT